MKPSPYPIEKTRDKPFSKGWVRGLLSLPAFLLISVIMQALGASLIFFYTGIEQEDLIQAIQGGGEMSLMMILQGSTLLGTLFITSLFRKYLDKKPYSTLGFSFKKFGRSFLEGTLVAAMILGAGSLFLFLMGHLTLQSLSFHPTHLTGLLFLCLLIALNEEILVRGYILTNLNESWSRYLAIPVSALLFTGLHAFNPGMNWIAIINIFLAGILLGQAFLKRKNLWFPVALHLAWNYLQGPVLGFPVSGLDLSPAMIDQELQGSMMLTGGEFGLEGSLVTSTLLIISILIMEKQG